MMNTSQPRQIVKIWGTLSLKPGLLSNKDTTL